MLIMFSCTFAPAAESYTMHLKERNKMMTMVVHIGCHLFYTTNIVILLGMEVKGLEIKNDDANWLDDNENTVIIIFHDI
ncbi:hypothetical protein DYE48_14025 [Halobacillus trueperi]|uniref:Uncharacterized protein n=1 Tax=Halobacillus trueperi TaxID=156205 RepID=A0A3E0J5K0_9BACI|nr:hypothetical protein DYE48_14025 [Halobacillus trueperi]